MDNLSNQEMTTAIMCYSLPFWYFFRHLQDILRIDAQHEIKAREGGSLLQEGIIS